MQFARTVAALSGLALFLALAHSSIAQAQLFTEYANVKTFVPNTDKFGEPTSGNAYSGGEAVAIFDANGDSRLDFVVVTGDPYYHLVLNSRAADGTPAFTAQPAVGIGLSGDQKKTSTKGLGLHDFNDDGLLDLYLCNTGRGTLKLRNPRPPFDVSPANINDAGLFLDSGFRVQLNAGDGTFAHADLGVDGDGTTRSGVFADFDADGHTDAFLTNAAYHGIWWNSGPAPNQVYPGLPGGTFGPDIIDTVVVNDPGDLWKDSLSRANKGFKGIVVRDFDRDGKPDVILGAFSDVWDSVGVPPIGAADPAGALVDLDGDGLPDGGYQGDWKRGILVLRNVSTPGTIRFEDVSATAIDNALGLTDQMHTYVTVPADIDNDGDLDLLASGPRYFFAHNSLELGTDRVRVYRNDSVPGTITFTNVTADSGVDFMNDDSALETFTAGAYPAVLPGLMIGGGDLVMTPLLSAAAAFDIDNDGDVDWVAIDRQLLSRNPLNNAEFAHWVFLNDGTGKFTALRPDEHGLLHTGRDLSYGDFNDDGRLDLVSVNGSGGGQTVDDNNFVFLNNVQNDNHYVLVNATLPGNELGLGTKVTVRQAGTSTILGYEELRTDFAYRSKRSSTLHFGLGAADRIDVQLVAPDGWTVQWNGLAADRTYRFDVAGTAWQCGNGILESAEQCDDGNTNVGDCCSAACQFQSGSCDDGDPCTAGDTCNDAGICVSGPPPACRDAEKSKIVASAKSPGKEHLVWNWKNGAATTQDEMGDPTSLTDYALCLRQGPSQTLAVDAVLSPSASWKATDKGYAYADRTGAVHGLVKVVLKGGAEGKSSVSLKGKGTNLPLPAFPLSLPVTVQLVSGTGNACYQASFSSSDKNTETEFKAKQ